MALVKCPECGKKVSSSAVACPECGYAVKEHFENNPIPIENEKTITTPSESKNDKRKKNQKTALIVLSIIFILIIILIAIGSGKDKNTTDNKTETKATTTEAINGEDYESAVLDAFWSGTSSILGIEYSDFKFTHTACSYICEQKTSDGYTSYYYLVETACETKNAYGTKVTHPITARCYYVPDYSNDVMVTYMTLDGEKVYYDEEKEDWLLGLGEKSTQSQTNKSSTEESKTPVATTKKHEKTTKKPSESTTKKPITKPTFTGDLCTNIDFYTGMPKYITSEFELTENICVAGKLSGVSGENNLVVRFTFPDGSTEDTMQYYIPNNDTIQVAIYAGDIGVGNGNVQVIFEETNEVLATYNYTIV